MGDLADDRLLAATDLVLLDIKSWEPDLYKSVTGVSLEPTLRFAKRLESKRIPVWIRFVLVPGITDGESNIRGLADYVGRLTKRRARGNPPLPQVRRSQIQSPRPPLQAHRDPCGE